MMAKGKFAARNTGAPAAGGARSRKSSAPPLPRLAPRDAESHKGDYGRDLLVGSSRGMTGAIALAGGAALRSGAGLVTLGVPASCQATVAGYEPSLMTIGLPEDAEGRLASAAGATIATLAENATVLACGPGIGRSTALTELVCWLYSNVARPMVFDADALFALARRPETLEQPAGPRVLTPHPGEFRRLVGDESLTDRAELESQAIALAKRTGCVIVLKGHCTLVTDGTQPIHNTTGNPGMATGGSGDVLTGVITGLLGQGLSPLDAAHLGVHVHGLAGDLAAAQLGEISLIASDLLKYLPRAFQQVAT